MSSVRILSNKRELSAIIHQPSASVEGVFYNKPQRRWWRRGLKYFIFVEG
jgi:hypothetical protein